MLLHGFGSSLHTWEDWAGPLAVDHRVIRFDLPGCGLSPPDPTGDYTDARSVAVLVALLDRLGVAKASVVGNSMGGRIAWTFAAAHPERVDKLVLISPDGFASPGFEYGRQPDVPSVMKAMRYVLPKPLVKMSLAPAYADPKVMTDALATRYYDLMRAPGVRDAMIARMQQSIRFDPVERLRTIRAPTLLLWGEEDRMIPFTNAADYEKAIPDATLVPLPGVGPPAAGGVAATVAGGGPAVPALAAQDTRFRRRPSRAATGCGNNRGPPTRWPAMKKPLAHDPSAFVRVRGAREHNLKNVDVDIPRDALVVFSGVSGSGKSSLAFGTLYAEAQRRYFESVAPYARRLIDQVGVPDVDCDRRAAARGRAAAAARHAEHALVGGQRHDAVEPAADAVLARRHLSARPADAVRRGLLAEHARGSLPDLPRPRSLYEVTERSMVPDDTRDDPRARRRRVAAGVARAEPARHPRHARLRRRHAVARPAARRIATGSSSPTSSRPCRSTPA